jgi:hypothetical protein
MKKFKQIISLLLVSFLAITSITVTDVHAASKLDRVKSSLGFDSNDSLYDHTQKDLLTNNYDFNENAKFTSNYKLMYRFALAYAVRNTSSRDNGKLYTNSWFEKHYKEILDKAYAGADTTVDFYTNDKKQLCIKVHMDGIYLEWGYRDAIRTEIIKDMAECGITIPRSRIKVTSSKKENASRINPIPGLSDTLQDWMGAANGVTVCYNMDGVETEPGKDDTFVFIYIDSTFEDAIEEYAIVHEMTEFEAVMKMFNSLEFDNLIDITIMYNDYSITNTGVQLLHNDYFKQASDYGLQIRHQYGDCVKYPITEKAAGCDYENDVQVQGELIEGNFDYCKDSMYGWMYHLEHQ